MVKIVVLRGKGVRFMMTAALGVESLLEIIVLEITLIMHSV